MHMADALLSPSVGASMWAVSSATLLVSAAGVRREHDEAATPLMGVLGAFLFAAQMINFSIPGTGSSGHLAGGILLALLLGPHAAFLTIASVLVVQALFFADGGILALGCNIFNLAFIPAYLVFPFVFRRLAGRDPRRPRLTAAIVVSALVALQLGAFAVVAETSCSGISALPFSTFLLVMQPIHLAIGVVEGVVTAGIVGFLLKARPEIVGRAFRGRGAPPGGGRVSVAFLVVTLVVAGIVSSHASKAPDGLEWSVAKVSGRQELPAPDRGLHRLAAYLQEKSALFARYRVERPTAARPAAGVAGAAADGESSGTGVAGTVGAMVTFAVSIGCAVLLRRGRTA